MNIHNTLQRNPFSSSSAFKPFAEYAKSCQPTLQELCCPAQTSLFSSRFETGLIPTPVLFHTAEAMKKGQSTKESMGAGSECESQKNNEVDKLEDRGKAGKWNQAEHQRFLQAMERYGNSWTQVQEYVGTRSAAQIRSHAQKYYCCLRKKEIKKVKNSPGARKAVFVVTREYRNTGTSTHRKTSTPMNGRVRVLNVQDCPRSTVATSIESKEPVFSVQRSIQEAPLSETYLREVNKSVVTNCAEIQ